MKKLIAVVIISSIAIAALIVLAFIYIDLSGHKGFTYELSMGGKPFASVKVDRYATEDKVIYKSREDSFRSLGYSVVSKKLFLKKGSMFPLKYTEEAGSGKGALRSIFLVQNGEKTDYLFLEPPRFLTLKGFETGEKTSVFSPYDVMLSMAVMERYNFWKKGAQFFEVMIPVDEPVPPMRENIEVTYLRDEYIPIMGRKVEAESYAIRADGLPRVDVWLARHTYRILSLEVKQAGARFVLTGFIEDPSKRFRPLVEKWDKILDLVKTKSMEISGREAKPEKEAKGGEIAGERSSDDPVRKKSGREDLFFESNKLMLSGGIWLPEGNGPFPAVLYVREDGPGTNGEEYLAQALGDFLSSSGYAVMVFDSPGHGKSQGSITDVDDAVRVQSIIDAFSYLKGRPGIEGNSIILIGHKGGGYLALEAAQDLPDASSCVIIGAPFELLNLGALGRFSEEDMQKLVGERGLGPFDEGYVEMVTDKVEGHLVEVTGSGEAIAYHMSVKVPVASYRDYITRDPFEVIQAFDRPLLLVLGKNERDIDPGQLDDLQNTLEKENERSRIAVFRNLRPYVGIMAQQDGVWTFTLDKDVMALVGNWVDEVLRYDEALSAEGEGAGIEGALNLSKVKNKS